MTKNNYCLILLSCLAVSLSAQGFSLPKDMFVGVGLESNGYSRSGATIGGSLLFGLDLNSNFSIGQKTGYYNDLNSLSAVEFLIFFRYYLPWLHWPSSDDGPFAQAEAGAVLIIERDYHDHDEIFPHFLGGISAGWRFNFPSNWYLEPSLRIGYPHIWGVGVTAGIRFKNKERITEIKEQVAASSEQIAVSSEQVAVSNKRVAVSNEQEIEIDTRWRVLAFENNKGIEEHLLIVRDGDGRLRIQVPPVTFRANHADFTGLSEALLDNNTNTLRRIAQMLNTYKEYQVLIEGHANPTTPEGARRESEKPSLMQLSENRARRTADELIRLGVDRDRLTTKGMGSDKEIVPYNDYHNSWKNRRVEFILSEGEWNE